MNQLLFEQPTRLPAQPRPSPADQWFVGLGQNPAATLRLYAFPFAGGDVSAFYHWRNRLPEHIELVCVQLPGRGKRATEQIADSFDAYLAPLSQLIEQQNMPFAFVGYSMGALLAYAVIGHLAENGMALPQHFFALACCPPTRHTFRWQEMSDGELMNILRRSDPKWMADVSEQELQGHLSVLRPDLHQCQHFVQHGAHPEINIPITTIAGTEDQLAMPHDMAMWHRLTRQSCINHRLKGGHFFMFHTSSHALLHILSKALALPASSTRVVPFTHFNSKETYS
ncbi:MULTISPECIES: alpha/beta fold hydrolase [Pseudoalteromonas]|uniref:Alpha/beta fold hydrolase n=1 Tax=Pseudoalteromonas rubra TaxID=43658 RepID=A0A5S3UUQ3_9GAMM|nr:MULTISPECIES: alpha/beta fold hydrolase [Pseudoalteromonas]MCG7563251.1 alpha/beta fold hydrolase [Pseudoalteromonas sp. McH1-42]QPB84389.1 alpha/beta fold hydrolase [Pseudoalteromonas rubra]